MFGLPSAPLVAALLATLVCACTPNEIARETPESVSRARTVSEPEQATPLPSAPAKPTQPDSSTVRTGSHFPREFLTTSMRGTSHDPYLDGNTIDALRAAHRQGIQYVEVDLIMTRDGALVTAHQSHVKGCGMVGNMLLNQVLGCRLGGGLKLAELGAVLDIPFKGIFLDLKDTRQDDVERGSRAVHEAAEVVVARGRQQSTVLMLYEPVPASLSAIRQHQLRAGLKGYPEDKQGTQEMVKLAASVGFEMLSVNAEHVTPNILATSARRGVWHLPWSTDPSQADHWRELAKGGAGGLIVLHYDLAREQVAPHWVDISAQQP